MKSLDTHIFYHILLLLFEFKPVQTTLLTLGSCKKMRPWVNKINFKSM